MKVLDQTINQYIENGIIENIAVRVGVGERVIYDTFRGGVDVHTLFDMASVTKIIATTTLALIAIDRGFLRVDDKVDQYYPTEKPLTIKHLLTHTMGIGYKLLTVEGNTYENIASKILDIPSDIRVGTDVRYSCPGFILLGKILEKIFEKPLDECFLEFVARPLNMTETSFLPQNKQNIVNANREEEKRGIVNDYNCRFLGGVSGNAGLFSNLLDATKYADFLLKKGKALISKKTFDMAAMNYTAEMSESRGLGFLYVDERYKQTGGLFADGAIGHCGHTGQSIFVDYRSGLYVIILSDATVSTAKKYGDVHYDEVVDLREKLHAAIKLDLGATY